MKSNYKCIGDIVEKIDIRNTNGDFTTNLVGLSIDKCFIPSVANTVGTDLSKYKVIHKDDFAVSLMQVSRDEKIPIARFDEEKAIMSPAYSIFRVKNKGEVLPEYLNLWFKRPEFDREASFIAVGGVRGSMPWNEFAGMKVAVPQMERQLEIVKAYKTIQNRIKIKCRLSNNLAEYLNCIYAEIVKEVHATTSLSTICSYVTKVSVSSTDV